MDSVRHLRVSTAMHASGDEATAAAGDVSLEGPMMSPVEGWVPLERVDPAVRIHGVPGGHAMGGFEQAPKPRSRVAKGRHRRR